MTQNKSIRQLEDRMSMQQPGTLRYEVLDAAKRFKSSWIDLGRFLWTVWKDKKFREWDYISFEAYCTKEIGIRSETAKKLLYSYSFLEREEPVVLQRIQESTPSAVPHYESVNALRLLSNKKADLPREDYERVRTQVLEKGTEVAEVRRGVRKIKEAMATDSEDAGEARRLAGIRRMIGMLRSMKTQMQTEDWVPAKLLREIESLTRQLEDLLPA